MNYAIVIAYEANIEQINRLCTQIHMQSFVPIIVDNSEKKVISEEEIMPYTTLISLGYNAGIAYAQNIGVKYALNNKADILVFLDQDSIIDDDILIILLETMKKQKLTVVAPVAVNKNTNEEYPVQRISKFGLTEDVYCYGKKEMQMVDVVIASGLMIKAEMFSKIGFWDEDFFIDFVDIEWCIRCKKSGVNIVVVPNAVMKHKIGDENFSFVFKTITMHSPVRTYYKVRNSFLLLRKSIPLGFSIRQIAAALILNFIGICLSGQIKEYGKYYFKGIYDGVLGRNGKIKY